MGTDIPAEGLQFEDGQRKALPSTTGDGMVQIAYLHTAHVSHSWHQSMSRLMMWDALHDGRVIGAGPPIAVSCGADGLVESRNLATEQWLDNTPHEWLMFVDTDMGFRPDSIDRLVEAADPDDRPVVGGLCFALKNIGADGYGGFRVAPLPTLFMPARDKDGQIGFIGRHTYQPDTLTQVAGTGAAFLLIHRSVAAAIREKFGPTWWDRVAYRNAQPVSEDLSFCWRVGAVGKPVFVHTGVRTTHHKQIWVGESDYTMPEAEPEYIKVRSEDER